MPLSNTTQDILRSSPYWDDYNRDKRFHRVLIKPRTPVQTRELNQIQSMLQNQVEQVTSSVYREGAAVSGGQQTLDTNGVVLQVLRDDAVDINNFFNPGVIGGDIFSSFDPMMVYIENDRTKVSKIQTFVQSKSIFIIFHRYTIFSYIAKFFISCTKPGST